MVVAAVSGSDMVAASSTIVEEVSELRAADPTIGVRPLLAKLRAEGSIPSWAGRKEVREVLKALKWSESEASAAAGLHAVDGCAQPPSELKFSGTAAAPPGASVACPISHDVERGAGTIHSTTCRLPHGRPLSRPLTRHASTELWVPKMDDGPGATNSQPVPAHHPVQPQPVRMSARDNRLAREEADRAAHVLMLKEHGKPVASLEELRETRRAVQEGNRDARQASQEKKKDARLAGKTRGRAEKDRQSTLHRDSDRAASAGAEPSPSLSSTHHLAPPHRTSPTQH